MKVFKFGGASVKNAEAVRNVGKILNLYKDEKIMVVVSAMGKTTNLLEELARTYFHRDERSYQILREIREFHQHIIKDLITSDEDRTYDDIDNIFIELECLVEKKTSENNFDFIYDQIVGFGEIISSKIVSNFLNEIGVKNRWVDARNFIITDDTYREGKVLWDETSDIISKKLVPFVNKRMVLTQGFIGRNASGATTTLGREGSDYSAAIFAYGLSAESVTIWKDVEGVMNADPKRVKNAVLLSSLSFNETIELAYYGATVIHPKTIQPLKSRDIPLFVKSFINPEAQGTIVGGENGESQVEVPCYIIKDKQAVISISTRDFSFIVEESLSNIFARFAEHKIRINLMQNSAISFSVCVNFEPEKIEKLQKALENEFKFELFSDMELVTIYNPSAEAIDEILRTREVILEQKMKNTIQFVVK